jgi:hypothetical protein
MKAMFPAITPERLVWVGLVVTLLTPIVWGLCWASQPISNHVPLFLQKVALSQQQWKFGPLAWFPAGFIIVTYAMWKAGWTK